MRDHPPDKKSGPEIVLNEMLHRFHGGPRHAADQPAGRVESLAQSGRRRRDLRRDGHGYGARAQRNGTFLDGTGSLGTAMLSSGVASLPASIASAGAHSITARYAGDTNNPASTSEAVSLEVGTDAGLVSPGNMTYVLLWRDEY